MLEGDVVKQSNNQSKEVILPTEWAEQLLNLARTIDLEAVIDETNNMVVLKMLAQVAQLKGYAESIESAIGKS